MSGPSNEADWLSPRVRATGTERSLDAGETLFRSGQRATGLYEILNGRVKLVRVDKSGRETVLYNAGAGSTLAEASLFSPTYHCDAIATAATTVRLYPKDAILQELRRSPDAAEAFIAGLARQVMSLRTQLERRNIRSARDRVRHFLALNVGADGRTIILPGSLKELAVELGLTHEALYRTLARMADNGEIERLEGKIRLSRPI
jgi:CRP/FNR family transcriptional regulator, dissimilatory nitrate respiration regulator